MRDAIVRFLRKPRLTSINVEWVDESHFQFGVVRTNESDKDSFTLSILGFVNGVLPTLTGFVFVVNDPENTFSIRKKWW